MLPIRYTGEAATPKCFKIHPNAKKHYSSQASAYMDENQFELWLLWWHSEVTLLSHGPCLLVLGNCGGHDTGLSLPGVHIQFLPPRTTAVH